MNDKLTLPQVLIFLPKSKDSKFTALVRNKSQKI